MKISPTPVSSKFVVNEKTGNYSVQSELTENEILEMALCITRAKLQKGVQISGPESVIKYLHSYLVGYEYEVFGVIFLDTQNCIIESQILFRGSISSASVYPREVAKEALKLNTSHVIYFHNHPSGDPSPSKADVDINKRLVDALNLFDIETLDHIVIGLENPISFKERGLF
jgi:DNA repair protein RadC